MIQKQQQETGGETSAGIRSRLAIAFPCATAAELSAMEQAIAADPKAPWTKIALQTPKGPRGTRDAEHCEWTPSAPEHEPSDGERLHSTESNDDGDTVELAPGSAPWA